MADSSARPALAQFVRSLLADTAAATLIAVFVALVLASFTAAGVVTVALATTLLILAWLVSAFLLAQLRHVSGVHKVISLGILAVLLLALWFYEFENRPTAAGPLAVTATPPRDAIPIPPPIKVFLAVTGPAPHSAFGRFEALPVEFDKIEDAPAAIAKKTAALVAENKIPRIRLRAGQDNTLVNVIIRNIGNATQKNSTVGIDSNVRIVPVSADAKVFSPWQIYYQNVNIGPYSDLGAEMYCSIYVDTSKSGVIGFGVSLTSDAIKKAVFVWAIIVQKEASPGTMQPEPSGPPR